MWVCTNCETINSLSRYECEVCGYPKASIPYTGMSEGERLDLRPPQLLLGRARLGAVLIGSVLFFVFGLLVIQVPLRGIVNYGGGAAATGALLANLVRSGKARWFARCLFGALIGVLFSVLCIAVVKMLYATFFSINSYEKLRALFVCVMTIEGVFAGLLMQFIKEVTCGDRTLVYRYRSCLYALLVLALIGGQVGFVIRAFLP